MKKATKKVVKKKTKQVKFSIEHVSDTELKAETLKRLRSSKAKLDENKKEADEQESYLDELYSAIDDVFTDGEADSLQDDFKSRIEDAKEDLELENLRDEITNIEKLINEFEMINFI